MVQVTLLYNREQDFFPGILITRVTCSKSHPLENACLHGSQGSLSQLMGCQNPDLHLEDIHQCAKKPLSNSRVNVTDFTQQGSLRAISITPGDTLSSEGEMRILSMKSVTD